MDPAISVRNLGKFYQLYDRPQDRLKQVWLRAVKSEKRLYNDFWALRDVSFDVPRGETVGIVGCNGSGKSTLLQLIAGTLKPSTGRIKVRGRVAALLELGSGFNPEFTGRENVYLNGAIWGFSRQEMDKLFDRIAAFADIGQFIDQPVKLYSSGMFVRLAFAVQVFVPKENFIVDEALAVGDEAFQRKCMAALERFKNNKGTVLLVSHDTQTIVRNCSSCILLHHGQMLAYGASKPVTDLYTRLMYSDHESAAGIIEALRREGLESALFDSKAGGSAGGAAKKMLVIKPKPPEKDAEPDDWFDPGMPKTDEVTYGTGDARITEFGIYNENNQLVNVLVAGRRYRLVYQVHFYTDTRDVQFGMMLKTRDGVEVTGIASRREGFHFEQIDKNTTVEACFSLNCNLVPAAYFMNIGVDGTVRGVSTYLHRRVDAAMIRVIPFDSRMHYGLVFMNQVFSYEIKPNGLNMEPLAEDTAENRWKTP